MFLLLGCKKKGNLADAGAEAGGGGGPDIEAFLKNDAAPLTPEIEEHLLLALKDCTVTDDGIDYKCEAFKNWNKSRSHKSLVGAVLSAGTNSLGGKHIGDESPAIRLKSAELLGSFFGSSKDTQKTVLDAAAKEKVPGVLAAMIRTVGSSHKQNAEVKDLLMKNSDHASEKVRIESMSWFLTSFGTGVPDTFEKVSEKIDKDPSVKVRAFLCSRLYGSGDERAIPIFTKYLSDKGTPDELFSSCFSGTIDSWTGFPKPAKPNKKAYELTLKVLEDKPRSDKRPPWTGISTLRAATDEQKPNDSFHNAWLVNVKSFYKKERLIAALEALAGDSAAGWLARGGAVDVMKELKAPKATFERLLKKMGTGSTDGLVKKKIEDALKAM